MNREIKFRAWNKEKRIMCYANEDNEACYWDGAYSSDVEMINFHLNMPEHLKEYEYMQYIGASDKNKKEIYEGDVVKIDGQQELFTIVWVCDTARFALQSKTQLLYFEFGLGSKIEVIGNIYENADLLKE